MLAQLEQSAEATLGNLVYDLALDVFKLTRDLPATARVGASIEGAALTALQRSTTGEKGEVIRALNHLRLLMRFAGDLGDISEAALERFEEALVRVRRSLGFAHV